MDGPQLSIQHQEGANALDPGQLLGMLAGRGVITGGEVHDASAPFSVQVMAANGWFALPADERRASVTDGNTTVGASVQPGGATVGVSEWVDDTHPRKVLICLARDGDGNVAGGDYHIMAGEPAAAKPADFDEYRNTSEPALPDLDGRPDLLPLGAGWLGANADEIREEHLWDRRQRPDATLRQLFVERIAAAELTDPGGVTHSGALADAADATPAAIRQAIYDDPDHATEASHNYYTDDQARGAVRGEVDVAELTGAAGSAGQLPFVASDGTAVNWATPPDEWGSLQALVDAAAVAGVTPSFDSIQVTDLEITGSYEWPDDTAGSTSPSASAGAVTVFADLGDVLTGPLADRAAASASGDWFFTTDENGIWYDDPAAATATWTLIAAHPGDIDAGDLGFDPVTEAELSTHAGTADAHHTRYDEAVADIEAHPDPLAVNITGGAGTLDGLESGQFVRSDENDTLSGRYDYTEAGNVQGARSAGEVARYGGLSSNFVRDIETDGRVVNTWNGYYDGTNWRYLVSDEQAVQTRITNAGEYQIRTAPASLSDEVINWDTATIEGGTINRADSAAQADTATQADSATEVGGFTAGEFIGGLSPMSIGEQLPSGTDSFTKTIHVPNGHRIIVQRIGVTTPSGTAGPDSRVQFLSFGSGGGASVEYSTAEQSVSVNITRPAGRYGLRLRNLTNVALNMTGRLYYALEAV